MIKKIDKNFFVFGAISLAILVFYCFYINFSIDTIILFLSNKIFLGQWLAKGVFPWFNPHIFLGTPYAFDVGIGSFHPFNLFFLLPYPYSFAVWMGATSFLFLSGFYLLLRDFTQTKKFAFLLTLILFLSGTGLFRANNPTIYIVIAHIGFFAWSIKYIDSKMRIPLSIGLLLVLSGHIQFVLYGILFGSFVGWRYYKISLRQLATFFTVLAVLSSWYVVFSLPLILESTRLTLSKDYSMVGKNSPLHFIQIIFPFIYGYMANGSKWLVGPLYIILISFVFSTLLGLILIKKPLLEKIILIILLLASVGLINLPFLRNAGQIISVFHMLGVLIIAQNEKYCSKLLQKIHKNSLMYASVICALFTFSAIFFLSNFFPQLFFLLLKFFNKQPSLFYDVQTLHAIGMLIAESIFLLCTYILLLAINTKVDIKIKLLIVFVFLEGLLFQAVFNFYIPTSVLIPKNSIRTSISPTYRVQSTPDVIPYHGISFYLGDVILQPPFSKETPYVNAKEKREYYHLSRLFELLPTTWIMTTTYSSIQGFNTFIPKEISEYFREPSSDYKREYEYIIKRNPLFTTLDEKPIINGLETSKITLYDPRWEKLGVRYFISDRPLKKYKLIEKNNGRYIYENEWAPPIYRVVKGDIMTAKQPTYQNPNEWHFAISSTESGSDFEMVMNPGGFVATLNDKPVAAHKEKFLIRVPLAAGGKLIIRYSPVEHLKETIADKVKFQLFK